MCNEWDVLSLEDEQSFFPRLAVCASFSGESACVCVCGLNCLCCALIRFCLPFVLLEVWEVIAVEVPGIMNERDAFLRKKSCRLRGLDMVSVSLMI